jgi:hypothetical protein
MESQTKYIKMREKNKCTIDRRATSEAFLLQKPMAPENRVSTEQIPIKSEQTTLIARQMVKQKI